MEPGKQIKKIVVIGPESTGKSTLCEQLAQYYKTIWCPEFAREYLLAHGAHYNYDDLLNIAKGQIALEEEYIQQVRLSGSREVRKNNESSFGLPDFLSSRLLFIDTDMYVLKVWCEFVFGNCHQWIIDQIVERKYDLYLLCNTDLPWTKDALREYPDLETREKLYAIYEDFMINQSTPWAEINGNTEERLQKAIAAVDALH